MVLAPRADLTTASSPQLREAMEEASPDSLLAAIEEPSSELLLAVVGAFADVPGRGGPEASSEALRPAVGWFSSDDPE